MPNRMNRNEMDDEEKNPCKPSLVLLSKYSWSKCVSNCCKVRAPKHSFTLQWCSYSGKNAFNSHWICEFVKVLQKHAHNIIYRIHTNSWMGTMHVIQISCIPIFAYGLFWHYTFHAPNSQTSRELLLRSLHRICNANPHHYRMGHNHVAEQEKKPYNLLISDTTEDLFATPWTGGMFSLSLALRQQQKKRCRPCYKRQQDKNSPVEWCTLPRKCTICGEEKFFLSNAENM